jgi:hypothetical protein
MKDGNMLNPGFYQNPFSQKICSFKAIAILNNPSRNFLFKKLSANTYQSPPKLPLYKPGKMPVYSW